VYGIIKMIEYQTERKKGQGSVNKKPVGRTAEAKYTG
jgi:hypothetical protein